MDDIKTKNNITVLGIFHKRLIGFLDELINQFPDEPDLVIMRILIKDQVPIKNIMENMKIKLYKCRNMIESRNELFFLQNDSLFSDVSKDKVNHFKKIWRSNSLDDDDREVIWLWIDSFVAISDEYKIAQNKI